MRALADTPPLKEEGDDRPADELALLWRPPAPDEPPDPRHTDRFLQTDLVAEELQRRLFYVRQQARTVLREQGYSVHYLALGFLSWTNPQDPAEVRKAPLILVPVELQRTRVASTFKLAWNGDDVLTNISLQEKLAEMQVVIPDFAMPDDKGGIDEYFMAVSEATAGQHGWQVTADIALDFFSFTKFVMYKDLDPQAWPEGQSPMDHPLVKQVLDPQHDTPPLTDFAVDDFDSTIDPSSLYYIMDADPSQIGVIEAVKAGHNLVVEGPPGTGKSQTITNLIAELLAAGRSVLFVSEKMAALEVVKDRLDRVGLGDYCLELHSRKTRKKEVLRELERTLNLRAPQAIDTAAEFSRLSDLTRDLNGYAEALRAPYGTIARSPYQLLEDIERCLQTFANSGRSRPAIDLPDAVDCTPEEYETAVRHVRELSDALQLVAPIRQHPWFGTDPRATLPPDEEEVANHIADTLDALDDIERLADGLVAVTAIRQPVSVCDFSPALEAANLIAQAPEVHVDILTHPDWDTPDAARSLISAVESYGGLRSAVAEVFVDHACTMDIAPLLEEYKQESARFLRFLSSRYRYLKREISMLYRGPAPAGIEQRISDLVRLVDLERARRAVVDRGLQGRALFGQLWRDERSDPGELGLFRKWMSGIRQAHRSGLITTRTLRLISTDLDRAVVIARHDQLAAACASFEEHYERLNERLSVDHGLVFGSPADNVEVAGLRQWLATLKGARDSVQRWSQFRARADRCTMTIAEGVPATVLDGQVVAEDLAPAFEAAVAENVLRQALCERRILSEFVGELHDQKRMRFAKLDRELIHSNRQRLARRLHEGRPRVQPGAPAGSEVGIIQGEFNRKRGHMPIRRLLSRAGRLIQRIKPCFMMSPLSIAQYLDPLTARFDVVIFDEASQVRPEDALGALLRGAQLVVMGDTRQLPPTSFFDHLADAAELDDESTSVAEVESILHQCKRSFATQSLRWHYRSRHQSLIAVSNQEFYDNRLNIYPSPVDHDDYLGLRFNHLPDTVYDRGTGGVNRDEARAVVATAMDLFRRYPNKSIGVGAFNIRQQQAILEEVELQLKQHPELEDHFAEDRIDEFFVKNLETIQGDERDIILISIGFGFDAAGKLSHNFGPLNQEGGERRLNVLITRARERCEVFSNFTADDLAVDPSSPFGLRALHAFLDFARRRHLRTHNRDLPADASSFERGIASFLNDAGFETRGQIGCASYRVDLGVVDPNESGRFLLGIEGDGPRYHAAQVARDRERLRAQVMEGLGWSLHRMWALDWYRDRQHCQERLLTLLENLRARPADPRPRYTRPSIQAVQYEESATIDADVHADGTIDPYVICPQRADWDVQRDLHDHTPHDLGVIIADVVNVEGPIHVEEVTRRLRTWWDLSRAGTRVRNAIESGIIEAVGARRIRRDRRDFLWPVPERPPPVRRRTGNPSPRLELICDEEIEAAAERVLDLYHAAFPDALARQVARCLGVRAISSAVSDRIHRVVKDAVTDGRLVQLTNGMLDRTAR